MGLKVNDLFVMDNVFNVQNNVSDVVANLQFPQKYITLEYGGELFNLDVVSVDGFEFVVKVVDSVDGGGRK